MIRSHLLSSTDLKVFPGETEPRISHVVLAAKLGIHPDELAKLIEENREALERIAPVRVTEQPARVLTWPRW